MGSSLTRWLRQPTTVLGFAALCGTFVAGIVYHLTGNGAYAGMAAGTVFSAFGIAFDDNSNLPSDVERLAIDAVTALAQQRLAALAPTLFGDLSMLAKDMLAQAATPAVPIAPAVPAPTVPATPPVPNAH